MKGVENTQHMEMNSAFAAGGMCSTVGDLVSWLHTLMHGRVISQEQVREMTTPARVRGQAQQDGAGLAIDVLDGYTRIYRLGAINGFSGQLAHYPERDLTIAVLTNVVPAGRSDRAAAVTDTGNELARAVLNSLR